MNEIWKPISGFEGRYEVSNYGNMRSLDRPLFYKDGRKGIRKGMPIKGAIDAYGYIVVSLDSTVRCLLHRLVAKEFIPCDSIYRTIINHKNGIKIDNRSENLEWATYQENNVHARKTGLNKQHGVNCNLSRHSDKFISAIRNVHKKYAPTYKELGDMFGISAGHANQIVRHKTRIKP